MPRFLNTSTGEFECHDDPRRVVYAILSHTWRLPEDGGEQIYGEVCALQAEVSQAVRTQQLAIPAESDDPKVIKPLLIPRPLSPANDFTRFTILTHPTLSPKIKMACEVARRDGYLLLWVDNCCIDKSNSAELSEAINSMFEWYRLADVCYAYLEDVPDDDDPTQAASYFWRSRWHIRGWTLQELIAPKRVVFLTRTWRFIGTKTGLASTLEKITGVDFKILTGHATVHSASVARRMSWAARRETTRIEDRAYSLLGIFDIHLSPIYGEGENAFLRLQEEIVRTIPDHSIFAWGSSCTLPSLTEGEGEVMNRRTSDNGIGLLAGTPLAFKGLANITPLSATDFATRLGLIAENVPPFHCLFTPQGVRVKLLCIDLAQTPQLFKALHFAPEHHALAPGDPSSTAQSTRDACPECMQMRFAFNVLALLQCEDDAGSIIALPVFGPSSPQQTSSQRSDTGLYVYFGSRCSGTIQGPSGATTSRGHCAFGPRPSFHMVCLSKASLREILEQASRPPPVLELSILRHSPRLADSVLDLPTEVAPFEAIELWPGDREDGPIFSLAPRTIDELGALGFCIRPLRCERGPTEIALKTFLTPDPQHRDSRLQVGLEQVVSLCVRLSSPETDGGLYPDSSFVSFAFEPLVRFTSGYVKDTRNEGPDGFHHLPAMMYVVPFTNGHIAAQTGSEWVIRVDPDFEQPISNWPLRYLRLALERPASGSTCVRDSKNVWVVIELSDKFVETVPSPKSQARSPVRAEDHSVSTLLTPSSPSEGSVGEGQCPTSSGQEDTQTSSSRSDPNLGEIYAYPQANSFGPSPSGVADHEPMGDTKTTCACWHSIEALRRENESLRAALSSQDDRVSALASQMATMMSRFQASTTSQGLLGSPSE